MEEDLKPIIVDGVDVSECNCLGVKLTKKHMCICDSRDFCNEEPNCYYKQLQREKQNSQEARDTAIKEFNRAEKLKMLLKRKEQECEKAKQNAQDTYDLWQALIESFNILQGKKIKLEQECESWRKTNDEKNELLAKVGCPTTAAARRQVFVLQQQIDQLKEELKEQTCGLRPELKRLINKICRKYDIEAKTYHEKIVEIIHSLDDYNQALIDIKEILKQGIKIHDDIIVSKQILQKAREVENEG